MQGSQDDEFVAKFEDISSFKICIELKCEENVKFSKVFEIDFRDLSYIGNDLSKMHPT